MLPPSSVASDPSSSAYVAPPSPSHVSTLTSSCPSSVIFLQEAGRTAEKTWSWSVNESGSWPQEFFPNRPKQASIHVFEYDVAPQTKLSLSDVVSAAALGLLAHGFLQAITEMDTGCHDAALFFVAHGLGGLICENVCRSLFFFRSR